MVFGCVDSGCPSSGLGLLLPYSEAFGHDTCRRLQVLCSRCLLPTSDLLAVEKDDVCDLGHAEAIRKIEGFRSLIGWMFMYKKTCICSLPSGSLSLLYINPSLLDGGRILSPTHSRDLS